MSQRSVFLALWMAGSLPGALVWGQESRTPILIKHADHVEILDQEQRVILSGDVHLLQETLEIRAEQIEYDMATHVIEAQGNVIIREGAVFIQADRVTYDVGDQGGVFEQAFVRSPPWNITAPRVEKRGTEELIFKSGRFSTCEHDNPHYKIRAAKVRIMTNRKLIAWHVFFYVGPVPVLYLPYFYRSLRDWRPPFKISVGNTQFLGRYVKTQFNYFFASRPDTEDSDEISILGSKGKIRHYGSVYLDEFQKKGWGTGFRHFFKIGSRRGHAYFNGDAYFYRVKKVEEPILGKRARWASSLGLAGTIPAPGGPLRVTAKSNLVSDEPFNRQYAVVNRAPGSHGDRRVSLSLSKTIFHLDVERQDRYVSEKKRFFKNRILLPRFSALLPSKRLGPLPLHLSIGGNWTREALAFRPGLDAQGNPVLDSFGREKRILGIDPKDPGSAIYPFAASGSYQLNITNPITVIRRRWTFNQRFGFNYVWAQPKLNEDPNKPRLLKTGNYRIGTTFYPVLRLITIQANRDLSLRLNQKEKFGGKVLRSDRSSGSVQFSASWSHITFRSRFTSTYDHLKIPVLPAKNDPLLVGLSRYTRLGTRVERRFGFLSHHLNLGLPRRNLTFNTNFSYSIAARDLRQVQGGITMTGKKLWRTRLDYTFINRRITTDGKLSTGQDNHFLFGFDITVPIFSVFRFTAIEKFDFSTGKFTNRRYRLYRDLHCWAAQINWDVLEGGETRVGFTISLKALPQRALRYRKDRFEQYRNFQGQEYIQQFQRDLNL